MHRMRRFSLAAAGAALLIPFALHAGAERSVPPPKEAKVLFSGKAEEMRANWVKRDSTEPAAWKVAGGAMVAGGGNIVSRETFTDFHLHIEFKTPYMPDKRGQARGNSGIFLQGRYEVQVLDSYGIPKPDAGDCGAIYSQHPPRVNACKPPRAWQTYDVFFRAPRFDAAGIRTERARVTILQNGILIHSNIEIEKPTWGGGPGALSDPGPVILQDHGNAVEYRNIWVIPLG